ncbi:MAG: phospholipase D-like domain-containing protein [Candidatus Micrarchaeota archaeon]|nr:phospholipase D-like domain-containing protein [Candidatus Micrarchaeota archaeon]
MGKTEWGMKETAICLLLILAAILIFYIALLPPAACAGCNAKVAMVFSPGAEGEVVSFIRSARESIDIEMYVFTSDTMARELGDAVKRGVKVCVILEPRVEDSRKQKMFDTLAALGVDGRWASFSYKLTHSKFIIVDGKRALVGSINFSESALNYNREAAVEVEGAKVAELVSVFEEDWQKASATESASGGTAAGE